MTPRDVVRMLVPRPPSTRGTSSRPKSDRGNRETHKFQWDCSTGVAYLNGTAQDWRVTRVLQAQLFGIASTDPSTFVSVAIGLLGVATLATLLPPNFITTHGASAFADAVTIALT